MQSLNACPFYYIDDYREAIPAIAPLSQQYPRGTQLSKDQMIHIAADVLNDMSDAILNGEKDMAQHPSAENILWAAHNLNRFKALIQQQED